MKKALPSLRRAIVADDGCGDGVEPLSASRIFGHLVGGEWHHVQRLGDDQVSTQLGEQRPERMLTREIVGAERRGDEDPLLA